MTFNTNWVEIQQELAEDEHAQHRLDLVSRIFRAKLFSLKKIIRERKFFGEIATMILVIEFQKRGLPHAYFLIISKHWSKIRQPEQFDKFVCAKIPPPPELYLCGFVLRHLMHSPCGLFNPKNPCMVKYSGKRIYRNVYPKEFTSFTKQSEDGYPLCKKHDSGAPVRIRGTDLDLWWVILYNPYLLATFDSHMNMEICSTIKVIKYHNKYGYPQISNACVKLELFAKKGYTDTKE